MQKFVEDFAGPCGSRRDARHKANQDGLTGVNTSLEVNLIPQTCMNLPQNMHRYYERSGGLHHCIPAGRLCTPSLSPQPFLKPRFHPGPHLGGVNVAEPGVDHALERRGRLGAVQGVDLSNNGAQFFDAGDG